ncbi:hypothetical protein [Streptomyces sp. NPDC060333]|uniref:hypothetical protein n=1 Tax=Streptomyces sp. NPDC060333 TaxID=3347098 RepID=UPI003656A119
MTKRVVWLGLIAGTVGGVVMTLGEKPEQTLTRRPDSHVPARVLQRLTELVAQAGLRGALAPAQFTVVRPTKDQILENSTGMGAPSQTWCHKELLIDVLHKNIHAFVTGAVADTFAARGGPGLGNATLPLAPAPTPM